MGAGDRQCVLAVAGGGGWAMDRRPVGGGGGPGARLVHGSRGQAAGEKNAANGRAHCNCLVS